MRQTICEKVAQACFVIKTEGDRKRLDRRSTHARDATQADVILLRRHQRQRFRASLFDQLLDLGGRERVVVGERARGRDVEAACAQGREEALRIADAGERENAIAAQGFDRTRFGNDTRLQDKPAPAPYLGGNAIGGGAFAGHQQSIRPLDLRGQRRAQRARRKHAGIADAAAAVDHDQRDVLAQ